MLLATLALKFSDAPLCFNTIYDLYSNDIADVLKIAKLKIYADDLTVYTIINNNNDRIKLQNDLNQ